MLVPGGNTAVKMSYTLVNGKIDMISPLYFGVKMQALDTILVTT